MHHPPPFLAPAAAVTAALTRIELLTNVAIYQITALLFNLALNDVQRVADALHARDHVVILNPVEQTTVSPDWPLAVRA